MTQAERRHDRLAVRLSMIIGRLVAGETLDMRKLAAEFGVSVRTLRRDFRESGPGVSSGPVSSAVR